MRVGMFVILDSKQGNKSLTVCPSMDLFKIKDISDCKMAITLVNVRTNSEQTVSPDRIELLTETDLISLHNNTDVFDIMAKANRKQRHNFKAGNFNANYKYYSLPEIDENLCKDNFPANDVIQVVNTDPQTSNIIDPDWPIRSENQEDQGHSIDKSGNARVQIQQIEHSQANQVPQTEKYSLRNRKVYNTLLISSQTNNYSNLCLKNLQAIMTRDGYAATRRALRIHAGICKVQNCPTCKFEIESRGYQFSPTNILNTTLIKDEIHTKQLITNKHECAIAAA